MNVKKLSKLVTITALIVMLTNNISYAFNLTKNDLKESLTKFFKSDIKFETKVSSNGVSSSVSSTYRAPTEFSITDDTIILREVGEIDGEEVELIHTIEYSLEENIATFRMDSDLETVVEGETDPNGIVTSILAELFLQNNSMMMTYLSIADFFNVDIEVAASYYNQIETSNSVIDDNEITGIYTQTISCDSFKRILKRHNDTGLIESSIEINIENLSKIDESFLNEGAKTTVTFLNEPTDDENSTTDEEDDNTSNNTPDNTTNDTENNTPDDTTDNTEDNITNNTTDNSENDTTNNKNNNIVNNTVTNNTPNNTVLVDNTTSDEIIPAAGTESIYCILMCFTIVSLVIYIKLRKYDDVE